MQHYKKTAKKIGLGFLLVALVFTMSPSLSQAQVSNSKAVRNLDPGQPYKYENEEGDYFFYLGYDLKRYSFPTPSVYFSWYKSESDLIPVTAEELIRYELGGEVTMRPGTRLIKTSEAQKIYAVEPNGFLRFIPNRQIFNALGYRTEMITVMPPWHFPSYSFGESLTAEVHPTGALLKAPNYHEVYYMENGHLRYITSEAFRANNFRSKAIIETDKVLMYPLGSPIEGYEAGLVTVAGPVPGEVLPDLVVEEIYVTQLDGISNVKAKVKNNSPIAITQNFGIEINYDFQPPSGPGTGGGAGFIEYFDWFPFETKEYNLGTIGIDFGRYSFSINVDTYDDIEESDENNNVMSREYEIVEEGLPDIQATQVYYQGIPGGIKEFRGVVKNDSAVGSSAPFTIRLTKRHERPDGTYQNSYEYIVDEDGMRPFETIEYVVGYLYDNDPTGNYVFSIYPDFYNDIEESDEGNNANFAELWHEGL